VSSHASTLAVDLEAALAEGPGGLARAALLLGRIESPGVSLAASMAALDDLGQRAAALVSESSYSTVSSRLRAINQFLYETEGFRANHTRYDDVRNSLLHVVLERRLGIPITLAVIYMTVARRASLDVFGITFPGHFLLRVPSDAGDDDHALILDPFDGGRALTRTAIRALLAQHAGPEAPFNERLLAPCTSRQIIVRMLNNMKRLYVSARSFAQAWTATDLLVTLDGRQPEDVRDRGLLAYHLDDFPSALRDLEAYLQAEGPAHEETQERRQIWEHVTALRRRVAAMN
jgi:regulator of sirC expression with transglutaminase-like and TPR domain